MPVQIASVMFPGYSRSVYFNRSIYNVKKSVCFLYHHYRINAICIVFGAGNLIFPPMLGQMAGKNVWIANAGFLVTGVGLPLLAITFFG